MWPAAVLASVALAGVPPAPDTPCAYVPPEPPKPKLSAFEQQVRAGMQIRRHYGMRADRAWVIRVFRSPRSREDFAFGPASPRELRYLRLRDKVLDATDVIRRYLRKQPVDVDAGYDLIDDEQGGGPFLVYKLSGDLARLEPELRARFPYPRHLRLQEVEYSERELDALVDRVFEDDEELEREGVHVRSGSADSATNRAEIDVITKRADVAELFAARYGPAVKVVVIETETHRLSCNRPAGYRASRDGRTLTLVWDTNSVYELVRIEVAESDRTVRIGIVEDAPQGPITAAAKAYRRRVRLAAPLGRRRVVWARNGRRIPTMRECARRRDRDPEAWVCVRRR